MTLQTKDEDARRPSDALICPFCNVATPFKGSTSSEGPSALDLSCECGRSFKLVVNGVHLIALFDVTDHAHPMRLL